MSHLVLLDSCATDDDWQKYEELDEGQYECGTQQNYVMFTIPILDFVEAALEWERSDKNVVQWHSARKLEAKLCEAQSCSLIEQIYANC